MSGVYTVVWDEKEKDRSPLLKPTEGGWPHITVMYCGDKISQKSKLLAIASHVLGGVLTGEPIRITGAKVNRCVVDGGERVRYDVLLTFDEAGVGCVGVWRDIVKQFLTPAEVADVYMGEPHITHKIFANEAAAEACAAQVRQLLPVCVTPIGVTID